MVEKLKLEIPLVLPEVQDERDSCVLRLMNALEQHDGIDCVHAIANRGQKPALLCVHYRPEVISLARIRQIAEQTGADLSDRFAHIVWETVGVGHVHYAQTIADHLLSMPGVVEAEVSPTGLIRLELDQSVADQEAILRQLGRLGVRVLGRLMPPSFREPEVQPPKPPAGHKLLAAEHLQLVLAGLAGLLIVLGFVLARWLALSKTAAAVYLGACVVAAWFPAIEMWQRLRAFRFEIDFLMLLAAAGAVTLGYYGEAALLLFLFSLGHSLEHLALERADRAIRSLSALMPQVATVRRNGRLEEVPTVRLNPGDVVLISPNQRIPCDGLVVAGHSSVDESTVTGESIPVEKFPVTQDDITADEDRCHKVLAGTLNGQGALEVCVTRRAEETVLAKVVRLVLEAETQMAPTQRLAVKIERIAVPIILLVVVLLCFAWVVVREPISASIYRAIAVLVAASPCALAIAIPSAVLSALACGARNALLIRNSQVLEALAKAHVVAFDKTGTLTAGKPRIVEVVTAAGFGSLELLELLVAVERKSEHPLARAIVGDWKRWLAETVQKQTDFRSERAQPGDAFARGNRGREPEVAENVRSIPGIGVEARVNGRHVFVGRLEACAQRAAVSEELLDRARQLAEQGRTIVAVAVGDKAAGIVALMDMPKPEARQAIGMLRALGVKVLAIISGDNQRTVKAIAEQLGIEEAYGDLLPEDKLELIWRFSSLGPVVMVGDGVNDAPALANADVGIAMAAAGSDVAMETAEIAVLGNDLRLVAFAIRLARRCLRIVWQNLVISIGTAAILVAAAFGGAQVGPIVALHEGTTVLVALNALRLLRFRFEDTGSIGGQAACVNG